MPLLDLGPHGTPFVASVTLLLTNLFSLGCVLSQRSTARASPTLCWPVNSSVYEYGPPEAALTFADAILCPLSMDIQFLTSPPRDVQEIRHICLIPWVPTPFRQTRPQIAPELPKFRRWAVLVTAMETGLKP